MKKLIIFVFVSVCFCSCSQKKKAIDFVTLKETEFNAKPFEIPNGKVWDSLKHVHDSCMSFSFDANALLLQRKNSLFIGSILNRQSLKTVNALSDLGFPQEQLISNFNMISKPCYEKRVLHLPLKLMLGENFALQIPNVSEALNKEINDAISTSGETEMQTGSWVYLDMTDALKNILDTTKLPQSLRYKENLLDTDNMVLTAAESITDVSFIINTQKNISEPLQDLLKSKPSILQPDGRTSARLFYIDNNKFQMSFNGFFPIVGEFMKAVLK
jgi:hypothetical protein